MKSAKTVNILTVLVMVLGVFQTGLLTAPFKNPATLTLVSGIMVFVVTGLTAWKQVLSEEINNKALWPTIIVAMIAIVGGLNDLIGSIRFSEDVSQILRWIITTVLSTLNLLSKQIWPTNQTVSKI